MNSQLSDLAAARYAALAAGQAGSFPAAVCMAKPQLRMAIEAVAIVFITLFNNVEA
jgi:hypothetical protein